MLRSLPAGQSIHVLWPVDGWYCPDAHAICPSIPLLGHLEPLGQVVHEAAPAAAYDPAEHSTGVSVVTEEHSWPAVHVVQEVEPAELNEPVPHWLCAVVVHECPAEHSVQLAWPAVE